MNPKDQQHRMQRVQVTGIDRTYCPKGLAKSKVNELIALAKHEVIPLTI